MGWIATSTQVNQLKQELADLRQETSAIRTMMEEIKQDQEKEEIEHEMDQLEDITITVNNVREVSASIMIGISAAGAYGVWALDSDFSRSLTIAAYSFFSTFGAVGVYFVWSAMRSTRSALRTRIQRLHDRRVLREFRARVRMRNSTDLQLNFRSEASIPP